MMTRLACFVVYRRKAVLVATLLLLVMTGPWALGASEALDKGNILSPPGSESAQARKILAEQFQSGDPNLILLVKARRGTVDSAPVAREGAALAEQVTRLLGTPASSYWTSGSPPSLRSKDATLALVVGRIPGSDNAVDRQIGRLAPLFERAGEGTIEVAVTGEAQVIHEINARSRDDTRKAELIVAPVLLVLMILVFGSVVAAALPLAVAVLSVIISYLTLRLVANVAYVQAEVLNFISLLALGLAIDYCLFIVSRFREELAAGHASHAAVIRTVRTAGVTVLFSAAAVTVAIAAIGVFPPHLNSFAFAGLAPAIAGAGAVFLLPALLAVLGPNVDRLRLFHRSATQAGEGFWHRLAMAVMHRPLLVAAACVAFLVLLAVPFVNAVFAIPDERSLPDGIPIRQALSEIRSNFSSNDSSALTVVAPAGGDPAKLRAQLSRYAAELSALPGVARVDAFTGRFSSGRLVEPESPSSRQRFGDPTGRGTWLSVSPATDLVPFSAEGEELVRQVRNLPAPSAVKVGGPAAQLVDIKAATFGRFPLLIVVLTLVTLVTMFLMLGSVVVPIKAILLNVLSLTATFGAMVWVFQEGHGADLLNFTPAPLDTIAPILVFCTAFGLSMDYEVFLLSRIKEEHDRGADSTSAVAMGLERTGRLVTAAAALLAAVWITVAFVNTATQGKMVSIGLSLAVLVDATVIRGLLVPAFMQLAGNANWWAPRSLRRLHGRLGFQHTTSELGPLQPGQTSQPVAAMESMSPSDQEAISR